MNDVDVLVVGAGPTGLALATALISNDVQVALVDRQPAAAHTSRAAAVNARTLEVLERVDVSRRLVKAGLVSPRFTVRQGARILMPVDFTGLPTAYPYTLMISQADTEAMLAERLTELGGAVLRPKELIGLAQDRDGVTATFADGDTVRARYVVGCDGGHSTVRERAGIGFAGSEYAESFALADVRLAGEVPDDEVILFYAMNGLTVLAPLPGRIHRIVAPSANAPEVPSLEFVQGVLDARGFGPGRTVATELVWGSRFRIHHRVADTFRRGRVLLAGDAAHVHSPAGGQGMNLGIQDAMALNDALVEALRGESDNVLDVYSAGRRPIAQQVLATTGRLTRLSTMPRAVRPVRNVAMRIAAHIPPVRTQLAWRLSGLVYR
ncbi:FAD-dependent oxidoreductase [Mycobacterium paraterrae]|uniref:FAD-dependent monooxygenase n=1 Tax=Mycobacterium paraterrae TaxID=577492 RepID=A0ABY3VVC9_9MYCO|nr:FAD-dependent oxidoreductase [Mycobacterium paraterrae]UMB70550.1 FAD-dependent monooxygenase [Mycobacterium paraterrae]